MIKSFNVRFARTFSFFAMLSASLLLPTQSAADVDPSYQSHPCLAEIEGLLDSVERDNITRPFCEGVFPGVEISLRNFHLLGDRRYSQGGGVRLLSFRHPFQLRGEINRLRLILVPRTNSLWDLHFEDPISGDGIVTQDGAFSYVIWGMDQAENRIFKGARPLPIDDNSMRLFRCNLVSDLGCSTTYNIPICEGYQYPLMNRSNPELPPPAARPILQVNAQNNAASERMLDNYDNISLLARSAIAEVMRISCQT